MLIDGNLLWPGGRVRVKRETDCFLREVLKEHNDGKSKTPFFVSSKVPKLNVVANHTKPSNSNFFPFFLLF